MALPAALTAFVTGLNTILSIVSVFYYVAKALKSPTYDKNAAITQCNPELPIPIIYGEHRVAGNIIWQDFSADKKYMYLLVGLGEGPIESITDVKVNDIAIGDLSGCSYDAYLGTSTQNVDARVTGGSAEVGGLRYLAYLALTLKASNKLSHASLPNITCVVKGRKVAAWGGDDWVSNLLTGNQSDVETDTTGFTADASVTMTRDTSKFRHGAASLKAVRTGGAVNGIGTTNTSALPAYQYTVSAYVYPTATESYKIFILFYNASLAQIGNADADFALTADEWTRIFVTAAAPVSTAYAALKIRPVNNGTQTWYMDQFMLYQGSGVSVWMPGQTDTGWTDNPVWGEIDLMLSLRYGAGYAESQLDLDAANVAAQDCDELVSGSPRFRLNMVIDWQEPYIETLRRMFMNHNAYVIERNGKQCVMATLPSASVQSYGPDNICPGSFSLGEPSLDEKYDVVWAHFTDPDQEWSRQCAECRGTEVNDPKILDIELYGTTSRAQASRLAAFHWRLHYYGSRVGQFKTSIHGADRTPGDVIDISRPALMMDQQLAWIEQMQAQDDHDIVFTWRWYNSLIFSDAEGSGASGASSNKLPNPWEAPPDPTNVAGSEVKFLDRDGHWVTGIDCTWTAAAGVFLEKYLVQLSRDNGVTYEDIAYSSGSGYRIAPLAAVSGGVAIDYIIKVKSVNSPLGNGLMSPGMISAVIHLSGDTTAPADPSLVPLITKGIKLITISYLKAEETDFSHYEIQRRDAAAEWDTGNQEYIVPAAPTWGDWSDVYAGDAVDWPDTSVATNTCYQYKYRVVDKSGNASGYSSASAAAVPRSVDTGDLHEIIVSRLARVPVRQTVLSSPVIGGMPNFLSAGAGLAVDLDLLTYGADQCVPGSGLSGGDLSTAAANLYDSDTSTAAVSAQTGAGISGVAYFGYDFGAPVTPDKYKMFTSGNILNNVSAVNVRWSDNGADWNTCDYDPIYNAANIWREYNTEAPGPHRYWCVQAAVNLSTGHPWAWKELRWLDADGDNISVGGVPLSGGVFSSGVNNAFDGNPATAWVSSQLGAGVNGAAYIGNDLGSAKVVRKITVTKWDVGANNIASVVVRGSADGVNWTNLWTVALSCASGSESILVPNNIGYRYWSLLANSALGAGQPWIVKELTMHLAASGDPMVATCAVGFDSGGAADYLIYIDESIADAWTGLANDDINYLYLDINAATRAVTRGSTTLRPVYAFDAPVAPADTQCWFDYSTWQMKAYDNGTASWIVKWRVFVGEVTTAEGAVTAEMEYALRGIQSIDTAQVLAVSTPQSSPHILGKMPWDLRATLLCVTPEFNWVAGEEIDLVSNFFEGTNSRRYTITSDATAVYLNIGAQTFAIIDKTAGGTVRVLTIGNWGFRFRLRAHP